MLKLIQVPLDKLNIEDLTQSILYLDNSIFATRDNSNLKFKDRLPELIKAREEMSYLRYLWVYSDMGKPCQEQYDVVIKAMQEAMVECYPLVKDDESYREYYL